MARDTVDDRPIENRESLLNWFSSGSKPKDEWRIGTEHEKIAFYTKDNSPVPFDGPQGIEALLKGMQSVLGWESIEDEGRIIGLAGADGEGAISIEPGGQFELSGAPLKTIHETCVESNKHLTAVKKVADELGIAFLGTGSSPVWTIEETPQMPKSRYAIMRRYMQTVGTRGLDMMYRTNTIQVNLDFSSEADMREKMQTSMKLQPLASALFANSPFTDGKVNGELSWRSGVWTDVDNQRAGFHSFMLEENFGFEHYLDWVLALPMYFIIRDGAYIDMTHITFKDFMQNGHDGHVATMGDWTNHVGTAFPDVRLKKFLEMRGADGGLWRNICALPAFWVGLLYDEEAQSLATEYVSNWTTEMVGNVRAQVPKKALSAEIGGTMLQEIAKDILKISKDGLERRARFNNSELDERLFLVPLEEIVAFGKTPAEQMLWRYNGPWQGDINRVFDDMSY